MAIPPRRVLVSTLVILLLLVGITSLLLYRVSAKPKEIVSAAFTQFKEKTNDVLGERTKITSTPSPTNTPTPNETQEIELSNDEEKIDCTGPDGVQFKALQKDCDELNSFWSRVNPQKKATDVNANSSNNASEDSSDSGTNSGTNQNQNTTTSGASPKPTTKPNAVAAVVRVSTNTPVPTEKPEPFRISVLCVKVKSSGKMTAYFIHEILTGDNSVTLSPSRIEGGEGDVPSRIYKKDNGRKLDIDGNKNTPITWIAGNQRATATESSPKCD